MKLVVYKYNTGPEIEHNINSFKIMMTNSTAEDFHIVRFSKMEKVGHIEHRARELYGLNPGQETRLWAKPEADSEWRSLFFRDKAVGVVLDISSDFTRPVIALETQDQDGRWIGGPEVPEKSDPELMEKVSLDTKVEFQESKRGQLLETSMFDDVTTSWEVDVHEQVDQAGRTLMGALHSHFNVFLQVS